VQIDAFTLGAQIFNFALLVVLLRVVLYRPILDAIRRREEEVAGRLEDARASREQAEEEADRYRRETERLERERARRISEAEREAAALEERLKAEVLEEVEILRKEWHQSLDREREGFLAELRTLIAREAFSIAEETLRTLANARLEEEAVRVFVRSLGDLAADERAQFEHAAGSAEGPLRVRSAIPIADEQRAVVLRALEQWLGDGIDVVFDVDRGLALGIEVVAADRKLGWSVASHLASLEAEAQAMLDRSRR
jgi:F-type H+-transporting ATPase subunit b